MFARRRSFSWVWPNALFGSEGQSVLTYRRHQNWGTELHHIYRAVKDGNQDAAGSLVEHEKTSVSGCAFAAACNEQSTKMIGRVIRPNKFKKR